MTNRSAILSIVLMTLVQCQPNVSYTTETITALRPSGIRVYITVHTTETNFIVFLNAMFYKSIRDTDTFDEVWGPATRQANGVWLYEELTVNLTVGMVVKYGVYELYYIPYINVVTDINDDAQVNLNLDGYKPDFKTFIVTGLEDQVSVCSPTVTKVRGRRVCAGEVIFEDNFDTLREDLWQIEQYIPTDHPEYPFVSYQRLASEPNVFVEDGHMHIVPKLQEELLRGKNVSILSGFLDLTEGCTRRMCSKLAFGSNILPPIVSGRLSSVAFTFTYGRIYVRAKLPQGDWLYPEILLEPLFKKYDSSKDISSIFKVAVAGGNRNIIEDTFGNKVLSGKPFMDNTCDMIFSDSYKRRRGKNQGFWGDDFHEYSLIWTPDIIELSVDGQPYLQHRHSFTNPESSHRCLKGDKFRPNFHDYLQLTLGVAAGGITEFPDFVRNGDGEAKPWRNGDPKASLNFWQKRHSWLPTWTQPGLIVDYVKVVAL